MRKSIVLMMCFLLAIGQSFAQNRTITGQVLDANGAPVPHASIVIKGTKVGTTAGEDGSFSLTLNGNQKTLLISSVGLGEKEFTLGASNSIVITLTSTSADLEEVVVVGYSTSTKEAFTGSAKVVAADRVDNKNVSNASQALAGEVAGVRVINTSGQPGTSATVRIRGIGSVNGNRSPLYVVDGVPYSGNINAINPSDIANFTVLKDAAATSIYGSRGANGVIVITTKTGKSRKSFVDVDAKYGTNLSLLPRYSVIESPEEFIELGWQALYNQGRATAASSSAPGKYANDRIFSTSGIDMRNNIWNVTGPNLIDSTTGKIKAGVSRLYDPEDWEDYAFQSSNRLEANVRMGGGNAKTNYYTSFGYLDDKGYSINSDFKRLVGRINLSHEVKSWLNTSFNMNYANSVTNNNGQASNSNSVFWFVDNIPSIYPLFLRDANGAKVADPIFGGYQYDYGATGRKFGSLTNAIADATYNTLRTTRNELTGNASVNIKFTKDLTLENRLGVQYYNSDYVSRTNKFYGSAASQNGSIYQQKTELTNTNLLNMLRYNKRFGLHRGEILVAHEVTDFKQTISTASAYNLVENDNLELNNGIVSNPVSSYSNTNKLESYFAQLNYDYNSTYYLSGTIRRDGSSRFLNDKWGNFGSVGVGWVISKMNFMRSVPLIDYLKLKASYGVLGDQSGVGYYSGYDRYDINNLNNNPSFAFVSKGNPDLTWETSKMFQAGVEFNLGKFLSAEVVYYIKNTSNLIFERRVGPSIGYALINVNDGKLRNEGLEFELTGHILQSSKFFLDLGINGEHFTNKITAMPIDPSTSMQKVIDVQGSYGWSVGHSVYDFYMRNFAGVDPATGTSTWTVYYEDLNGDGAFNSGEQVLNLEDYYSKNPDKKDKLLTSTTKTYSQATQYYIGKSTLPKVRGGINLTGGFAGIDLAVQLLYNLGGYAYDGAYAGLMNNGLIGGNNWSTDIRNAWKNPGDVTTIPRLSNNLDANVNSASTRFLTKANYLSLNNVRLGYTLPSNWMQKTKVLDQLSFWVSGDNLWLGSARDGFNPSTDESGASSVYRYSPLSTVTFGLRAKF